MWPPRAQSSTTIGWLGSGHAGTPCTGGTKEVTIVVDPQSTYQWKCEKKLKLLITDLLLCNPGRFVSQSRRIRLWPFVLQEPSTLAYHPNQCNPDSKAKYGHCAPCSRRFVSLVGFRSSEKR